GGLNGIFEADEVVATWLGQRRDENQDAQYFRADLQAPYVASYPIDLVRLGPQVAKPFSPDNVMPVEAALGMPLDGCFLGACTTTEEELVLAALVLERAFKNREAVPPSPKKLVVAGDLSIQERMRQGGLWEIYQKAGFRIGAPGCSMCLGVASEKALPGEVWLSSQNRNYPNRMGAGSLAWLASAATVAASSADMKVQDPRIHLGEIDQDRHARLLFRHPQRPPPEIRASEPEIRTEAEQAHRAEGPQKGTRIISGRVQRFGDHVDTDAIIPGEFCHLTQLSELG